MKQRCDWGGEDNELMMEYHDTEWGVPVHDDRKHFEFLILEGAQAGLSWLTILKRREGYREAFAGFDPHVVAEYNEKKIDELVRNEAIIRNRRKIEAAVNNAQRYLVIQDEFGDFDSYIWQFVDGEPIDHALTPDDEMPVFTKEAEALSKDMKQRGFTFVGPTVLYAHMQACGLVNDHMTHCFRYEAVKQM